MSEFEIVPSVEGDRDRLAAVMAQKSPDDFARRYEWIYRSNPHGPALSWLALERATGEPVGCTSLFPRRVVVDGRVRRGSLGGDCYVLPRVRRRGLATELHRVSLGAMRSYGVDFMYGPPRPANLGALLKAGSHVVTRFRAWARPLRPGRVFEGMSSPVRWLAEAVAAVWSRATRGSAGPLRLERVDSFGPEFDRMFEEAARGYRVVCVRDAAYLTWRYLRVPVRRQVPLALRRGGELVGFMAVQSSGRRMALTDLFCRLDPGLVDQALQAAVHHALAAGGGRLRASFTEGCVVARRLWRRGFVRRGDAWGFQVAASSDDPQAAILWDPSAWHFSSADNDVDGALPTGGAPLLDEGPGGRG